MEELRRQRDLAQSQVEELRKKLEEEKVCIFLHPFFFNKSLLNVILPGLISTLLAYALQKIKPSDSPSPAAKKCLSFSGTLLTKLDGRELGRCERARHALGRQSLRQSSTAPFTLMHEIRKLEHLQDQLGEEATRALDVLQKEVSCHRQGNQDAAETIAKLQAEIRGMRSIQPVAKDVVEVGNVLPVNKSISANLKEEITRLHSQGSTIADLEEKLENVQKSIDKLVMSLPTKRDQPSTDNSPKTKNPDKKKKLMPLASNNSLNMQSLIKSPCSPLTVSQQVMDREIENRPPVSDASETHSVSDKDTPTKSEGGDASSKENIPYRRSSSVNMRKMQKMFQNAAEENVRSIKAYVTELKERVAKLQYQKQLLVCQVQTLFDIYSSLKRVNSISFHLAYTLTYDSFFRCLNWKQMRQLDIIWRTMRTFLRSKRSHQLLGIWFSGNKGSRSSSYGIFAMFPSFTGLNSICYSRGILPIKYTWKWSSDA